MTIRFEQVSFSYGDSAAGVFDIDLTIEHGELVAVIGASGSGKTTILKLLAGFLRPDRGRILIDGQDVTDLPPQRRELGVVFQSYALFQHMTAWQNVAYPLKVRGVAPQTRKAQAIEALAMVNLKGFEGRLPRTLSGGQQQRVALARALVFRPRGLLLDEPLSALDAALRGSMRDEITRVQQAADISTLHVTHDQEEALSMANRVAVLEQGRMMQIAPPRELYERPCSRSVAAFVGQANLWDARVAAPGTIETAFGSLACDTAHCAQGQPIVALVRPEDVRPLTVASPDAANNFTGSVVRDRFLGAVRRYDFQVGDAVIQGETSIPGCIEAVAIPPEAVRLLPAEPLTHKP